MKIAIPMEESNTDTGLSPSFGRAPVFLLYDTKTGRTQFYTNPAVSAPDGAGVKAAQFIVARKADALICCRCGENTAQVFRAAGITVYKAADGSAKENLSAFAKGKLPHMIKFCAGRQNSL